MTKETVLAAWTFDRVKRGHILCRPPKADTSGKAVKTEGPERREPENFLCIIGLENRGEIP